MSVDILMLTYKVDLLVQPTDCGKVVSGMHVWYDIRCEWRRAEDPRGIGTNGVLPSTEA